MQISMSFYTKESASSIQSNLGVFPRRKINCFGTLGSKSNFGIFIREAKAALGFYPCSQSKFGILSEQIWHFIKADKETLGVTPGIQSNVGTLGSQSIFGIYPGMDTLGFYKWSQIINFGILSRQPKQIWDFNQAEKATYSLWEWEI